MLDPYHRWLGIPKHLRPPTYYQLLGIAPDETDREVIEEAALRQTSHVRTYQTGPFAQPCTALLNEIAQAKATLLNPAKRKEYDARLAEALPAVPPPAPPPTDQPAWTGAETAFTPEPPAFPALADAGPPAFLPAGGTIAAPADLARYRGGGLAPFLVGAVYLALLLAGGAVTFKLSFNSAAGLADDATPAPVTPVEPGPALPASRATRLKGQESIVNALTGLADGGPLFAAGGTLFGPQPTPVDCIVRGWDLKDGKPVHRFAFAEAPVRSLAVSADGKRLLAGSGGYRERLAERQPVDCVVRLYEVATGRPTATLQEHTGPPVAVAFVPGGNRAVSCGEDFTARLWDLNSGRQERLLDRLPAVPRGVAVAPDGGHALIGCVDGTLRRWNLTDGTEQPGSTQAIGPIAAVGYGPDGWRIVHIPEQGRERTPAVVGEGKVPVRRSLTGAPRAALCWAFSADAALVACGTSDGQVTVWIAGTGKQLFWTHDPDRPVTVVTVLTGRQGDAVAAGTADGGVWYWPISSSR
ncbi:MAG: hypothetical protein U0736_02955 [Gemmataceae bacterium]